MDRRIILAATTCMALAASISAPALPRGDEAAPPASVDLSRDATVAASGDFLIHSPVWQRAAANARRGYDFRPMLARIRPIVKSADLALCQLETPMTPAPPRGYPIFNAPAALAPAIAWAGYDICATASNHTLDLGQGGIDATIATLDRAGIDHVGSATSARGARRIPIHDANGIRVAILAYSQVSNGHAIPHPWSVAWASPRRIRADVARARARGAEAVVVNIHWGEEYAHEPSPAQWQLARAVTAMRGVTAVVGQHAHVVQRIRRVGRIPVVFGEGNLISNQGAHAGLPAASQDGLIALLRLRRDTSGAVGLRRVDYVPTYVRHPDFVVTPASPTGDATSRASWSRTRAIAGHGPMHGPVRR